MADPKPDTKSDPDADTVKVRTEPNVKTIPVSEFKPGEHVVINEPAPTPPAASPGPGGVKNPSGTFSEPTPTDIRYPDKDATEFENNHGAFVRRSAAQMREDQGLPDAPGGVYPDGHIPDDFETLPENTRVSMARRVSNRPDVNAAEANDVIRGEVDRRKNDPEWQKKRSEHEGKRRESTGADTPSRPASQRVGAANPSPAAGPSAGKP